MTRIDRRSVMTGLAVAPLFAATSAVAQDPTPLSGIDVTVPREAPQITPYTIEELFRPAPALDADLSADGKHVGLLLDAAEGDARETQLLVFSADDPTVGEARFRLGDTNAGWVRWAGSGRLLIGVSGSSPTSFRRARYFQRFTDQERELPYRRVMAVALDGAPPVQLFQPAAGPRVRIPPEKFRKVLNLAEVVAIPDGDHALMAAFSKEEIDARWLSHPPALGSGMSEGLRQFHASRQLERGPPLSVVSLFRLDLATGEPELVMEGSNRTMRWEAQNGVAILRRDIDPEGQSETWRTQEGGSATWKPVRTVSRADPDLIFLAASDRPRMVWVLGRQAGERARSVRLWDIDANTFDPPVSMRADRDPVSVLIDSEGRFLLASYRGQRGLEHDTPDQGLTTMLAALAVQFGPDAAVRVMHVAPERTKVLVEVSGPQQPRAFFLFDGARRRLADIGGVPRLLPERLADAEPVVIAGPGGAPLTGILTGSLDGKPGPLVVILQASADTEQLYGFDPMAQVFAGHGWWTLRVADSGPADVQALVAEAIRKAGLDGSRTVIFGQGLAASAALQRIGSFKAAIAFDGPEAEDRLLAGMTVGPRDRYSVRATAGDKPVLVVRNWRDARGGRIDDSRLGLALQQNDVGTLADAIAIGEAGDADWTKLETQVARARAVVEFLDPILK